MRRILRQSVTRESTAAIDCAIKVAHATPATPILKEITKTRSRMIFKTEEKIKKYKGVLESPKAVKIELEALYRKRKKKPKI